MSSETSTDSSQSLQPWQLFTLAGLVGATLVVFLSRGQSASTVVVLSLTIFAAAAVGLAALRTFVPLTGSVDVGAPQVLGGRTRAALEREKTLVLRSIKELEFDRAMGKISEKDFGEMSARLRSRAAGLLRQLDAGSGYRQQIEREVERRLGASRERRPPSVEPSRGTRPSVLRCASCETANDADARFCKECGGRLGTVAAADSVDRVEG